MSNNEALHSRKKSKLMDILGSEITKTDVMPQTDVIIIDDGILSAIPCVTYMFKAYPQ